MTALVAASVLVAPPPASAHADYERSSPAAGAAVAEAPPRLEVWFTQELFRREGANALEVTDADGASVVEGESAVDDGDRTLMSIALRPDLEAGTYTVAWRSLSAIDGDEAEGTFTFTIDPSVPSPTLQTATAAATTGSSATLGSEVTSTSGPTSAIADDGGGARFPWWALVVAGGLLASGAIGGWALWGSAPEGGRP